MHNNAKLTALEEAKLLHPDYQTTFGQFYLGTIKNGEFVQTSYQLKSLERVISSLPSNEPYFISQAEFKYENAKQGRTKKGFLRVYCNFVDLDVHSKPTEYFNNVPNGYLVQCILSYCQDNLIQSPNIITSSGRGYHLKWLYEKPVLPVAMNRWQQVQDELIKKFEALAADPVVRDNSRFLRLVGSINEKSLTQVETLYVNTERYGFDIFYNEIMPHTREEAKAYKLEKEEQRKQAEKKKKENQKKRNGNQNFNLNQARYEDVLKLGDMRGGFREGERMNMLFWALNFYALSGKMSEFGVMSKAKSIIRKYCSNFKLRERELSTFVKKVEDYRKGKTVSFFGKTYPPLCTPRNSTLIKLLAITEEEQKGLYTIISKEEKARRDKTRKAQKRRLNGSKSREDYEKNSASRNKPWEVLCMGRTKYYELKKKGLLPAD